MGVPPVRDAAALQAGLEVSAGSTALLFIAQ
jgi:hypothetical protein